MSDCTVHMYTAAESGLFVNSYLLETATGVVVVDTNLLVSDSDALRARLDALHKPLLGIFLTHAHPDHFNGTLALVRDREVPVYATGAVAKVPSGSPFTNGGACCDPFSVASARSAFMSVRAGAASYAIFTSSAPCVACSSVSATTTAICWPT